MTLEQFSANDSSFSKLGTFTYEYNNDDMLVRPSNHDNVFLEKSGVLPSVGIEGDSRKPAGNHQQLEDSRRPLMQGKHERADRIPRSEAQPSDSTHLKNGEAEVTREAHPRIPIPGGGFIEAPDMPRNFKANTPDGGMSIPTAEGTTTFWPDGSVRVMRSNGSGYSYNPDGNGGYTLRNWGKFDHENFQWNMRSH